MIRRKNRHYGFNCLLLILTYDFTPPVKHKNREGWLICEGNHELDHLIH